MARQIIQRYALWFLLFITLVTYFPCLSGPFLYDDVRFIKQNPFMDARLDPSAPFHDPGTMEELPVHDIYRPLRTVFFQLEYALGQGAPWVHHCVGLFFHLLNICLVYGFILHLLADRKDRPGQHGAAICGAALFALHPVQVESVAWISSRGDQLVCFFVLLALHGMTRPGRMGLVTGSLTLMACFAKESGLMLLPLFLLARILFKGSSLRPAWKHGIFALTGAIIYICMRTNALGPLESQVLPHGGSLGSNFLYACFGQAYQASLIFRPWFSNLDYQAGFFQGWSLAAVSGIGLSFLGLLGMTLLFSRRYPLLQFALLFYLVAQLPTSSLVFTLRSLVNDRYLYLPMVGVALFLSLVLADKGRSGRYIIQGILVLLGLLAVFSFSRARDWQDRESLWSAALKTHPQSIRARLGLSTAAYNQGDLDRALYWAEEVLKRAETGTSLKTQAFLASAKTADHLGNTTASDAFLRQALQESEALGEKASSSPLLAMASRYLWASAMQAGRHEEGIYAARSLMRHEGESAEGLLLLAQACRLGGDWQAAETWLKKGAAREEGLPEIHQALSELYQMTSRPVQAEEEHLKFLRMKDHSPKGRQ